MFSWTHPKSKSQRTSRSVQPFLTRHGRESLYFTKLPLRMGDLNPCLTHGSWAHPSPQPKWILISSAVFHNSRQSVRIPYNGPPLSPSKLPLACFARRVWTPSNTWFLGPTQVHDPNNVSISSVVFAELTIVTDQQTDRPR